MYLLLNEVGVELTKQQIDLDYVSFPSEKQSTYMYKMYSILPYTDVCIALHTRCFPSVCEKNSQATRAGFEPTTYLHLNLSS